MVYGKIFRKPFSKTREGALDRPISRISSLSSHSLLSALFLTVPSHPQPPRQPPPAPRATSFSLSPSSCPANPEPPRFLSHRSLCSHRRHRHRHTEATVTVAPKPPRFLLTDLSARTEASPCTDLYRSHLKGPPSICTDLYLTDQISILI
jgi:hypothetical protein